MKDIFSFSVFLGGMLLLAGCEKAIDLEIPVDPPKLTLEARLFAGQADSSFTRALVGTSAYSLSAENPKYNYEAQLFLYENDVFIDTFTGGPAFIGYPGLGNFTHQIQYEFQPSFRYRIEARHPDFETAFGETLIPETVPIDSIYFRSAGGTYLELFFTDPPSRGDIYQFNMTYQSQPDTPYIFSYPFLQFQTNDPTLEFFQFQWENPNPLGIVTKKIGWIAYLRDETFDGQQKKIGVNLLPLYDTIISVELTHITEDYYHHELTKSQNHFGGSFSEPTTLHGNITNGYGIVAGGAVARKVVRF